MPTHTHTQAPFCCLVAYSPITSPTLPSPVSVTPYLAKASNLLIKMQFRESSSPGIHTAPLIAVISRGMKITPRFSSVLFSLLCWELIISLTPHHFSGFSQNSPRSEMSWPSVWIEEPDTCCSLPSEKQMEHHFFLYKTRLLRYQLLT